MSEPCRWRRGEEYVACSDDGTSRERTDWNGKIQSLREVRRGTGSR